MCQDIKSALHDATPSWNGFNYQGKVGLYVFLKLVCTELGRSTIDSELFSTFLEEHSIEYEWIEDFAIKRNESYISLHQVKHKAGTSFSEHVSAIDTILNRKLGRLSESDLARYISFDYSKCSTPDDRRRKEREVLSSIIGSLISNGVLTSESKLSGKPFTVDMPGFGEHAIGVSKFINEFKEFTTHVFSSSKVYFHTSNDVSKPSKKICEYKGISQNHLDSNLQDYSLLNLNIHIGFERCDEYKLVLSESELNSCLDNLISNILDKIHNKQDFFADDIVVYRASLTMLIDEHISSRHDDIRCDDGNESVYRKKKQGVKFKDLFSVLSRLLVEQNEEYWERFCASIFEEVFCNEVNKINELISGGESYDKNMEYKNRLDVFRRKVIKGMHYAQLLEVLSPHESKRRQRAMNYYNKIAQSNLIKNVYLKLIKEVECCCGSYIITSSGVSYHPSIISLDDDDHSSWRYELDKRRSEITENNPESLRYASRLVVRSVSSFDDELINERVFLRNLVECVDSKDDIVNSVDSTFFDSISNLCKVPHCD